MQRIIIIFKNIGIEQKRYIPDWQLNYAGQYKNIIFNEIPENIPLEMKSKLFSTLDTIPDLKDLSNPRHENLTLSDFLDRFDFSYVLHASIDEDDKYYYPHGYITLEDEQGANLGDIEIEKYGQQYRGYSKTSLKD